MSKVKMGRLVKATCLDCGYWNPEKAHRYKCYCKGCPAQHRDTERRDGRLEERKKQQRERRKLKENIS